VATYDFVVVGGGAAGAPFVFSMVQGARGWPEVVVIFFLRKDYLSLQLIAKAPENGWLEYDRFLLGPGIFSSANC